MAVSTPPAHHSPSASIRASGEILEAAHGAEGGGDDEELVEPVALAFNDTIDAADGKEGDNLPTESTNVTDNNEEGKSEWERGLEEVEQLEEEAEVQGSEEEAAQPAAQRARFVDTNNSFHELSDHNEEDDEEESNEDWKDALDTEEEEEDLEDDAISADEAAALSLDGSNENKDAHNNNGGEDINNGGEESGGGEDANNDGGAPAGNTTYSSASPTSYAAAAAAPAAAAPAATIHLLALPLRSRLCSSQIELW